MGVGVWVLGRELLPCVCVFFWGGRGLVVGCEMCGGKRAAQLLAGIRRSAARLLRKRERSKGTKPQW